jgi:predicted transcriptional regulator
MIVDNQRRTSQIVAAYVRKNLIPTDQIAGLINSVHSTLSGLGSEVVEEPPHVPAVSVRRSIRPDHIICIDCGYKGKMLKRHLQSRHGLSVVEYKRRWNLSPDYPMTAPNYSEQRAQFAKKIGLGRTPAQPTAVPEAAPATTTEKPARRRSASKTTTSRTSAKKASPENSAKKADSKTSASKASPKNQRQERHSQGEQKVGNRSRKLATRASKASSAPATA